jgi:hypothetical protein
LFSGTRVFRLNQRFSSNFVDLWFGFCANPCARGRFAHAHLGFESILWEIADAEGVLVFPSRDFRPSIGNFSCPRVNFKRQNDCAASRKGNVLCSVVFDVARCLVVSRPFLSPAITHIILGSVWVSRSLPVVSHTSNVGKYLRDGKSPNWAHLVFMDLPNPMPFRKDNTEVLLRAIWFLEDGYQSETATRHGDLASVGASLDPSDASASSRSRPLG